MSILKVFNQKVVAPTVVKSGILAPFLSASNNRNIVTLFHGTVPQEYRIHNRHMDVNTFKEIITHLRKRFHIVTSNELQDKDLISRKKKLVLTFDDGYYNNYLFSFPFLIEHKLPFTLFAITCSMNSENYYMPVDYVDFIINKYSPSRIDLGGNSFLKETNYTHNNENIYSYLINNTRLKDSQISELKSAFPIKSEDIKLFDINARLMNLNEYESLSSEDNVTIGSHTIDHVNLLSSYTTEELELQLSSSKVRIEAVTGKKCDSFAYPYGYYNLSIKNMAQHAGYKSLFPVDYQADIDKNDPNSFNRVCFSSSTNAYVNMLILYRHILRN